MSDSGYARRSSWWNGLNISRKFGLYSKSGKASPVTIFHLPNEILTEIFLFTTVPSHGDSDEFDFELASRTPVHSSNVMASPFPLSQVCRLWRTIVLDTKSMWRSIAVYNPSERHVHRVRLWVERVRNCKLNIGLHLDCSEERLSAKQRALEQILELFGRRLENWQALKFETGDYFPASLVTHLKKLETLATPSLRKVVISTTATGPLVDRIWKSVHNMSNLETFIWGGPQLYQASVGPNPHINLLELTSLEGPRRHGFATRSFFLNMFSPYPNLQELHLALRLPRSMATGAGSGLEDLSPIVLPKVYWLTIDVGDNLSLFVGALSTPVLTCLHVTSACIDDANQVQEFLQRSQCTLNQFVLNSSHFDMWFDLDALQTVQTLQLYSDGPFDIEGIAWLLHCPPLAGKRKDSFYPYFTNIHYLLIDGRNWRTTKFDDKALLLMLDARFGMVPLGAAPKTQLLTAEISLPKLTESLIDYQWRVDGRAGRRVYFNVR